MKHERRFGAPRHFAQQLRKYASKAAISKLGWFVDDTF